MNLFFRLKNLCFLTLLCVITSCSIASAQFNLSGEILDGKTGEPLPFANVYIANTTLGINSEKDGSFVLEDVPEGNQEMIFSFIGYEVFVRKINVNKYSAERSITIKLKPSTIGLTEVEVKALNKKKRKRFLKKFEKAFLGKTLNSKKCKILNPQVIDFQQNGKKVSATARDFIEVENRSTGYLMKFYVEKFEMEGSQVSYGGKPLFKELKSEDVDELAVWKENRKATFQGSPRHFYEALVNDNLRKEGFKIFFSQQKNTREFHNVRPTKAKNILEKSNSSQYHYLKINDFLKVVFTKEKKQIQRDLGRGVSKLGRAAEHDLIQQTQKDLGELTSHPTSYLFARKSAMKISKEGRLFKPELMLVYGEWANEGVADLLPFDFKMDLDENKNTQNVPSKKGFVLENLLIPLDEIKDGGPPKDGIPSIDYPKFIEADEASFLKNKDEILGLNFNGVVKVFPIKIMNRHEIVNDAFGGIPVAVTFCPLCGSGVGVLSNVENQRRSFGVSGLLYNSDVLLYDRETESLWSQILGKAISGKSSGESLDFLPVEWTTWEEWKKRFPNSLVLSNQTGFKIDYEKEIYQRYFETQKLMFPVQATSDQFKNKDKIIGIEVDGEFKAYALKKLKKRKEPIRDEFNGKNLIIFYDKKSNSARIENEEGKVLNGMTMFWFAWYAFHPETEVF